MTQKKGTTTNLTKLAGWDTDYYLSLSDDECLVCLTQKELYLLRNPLRQMEWSTRWQSQIGTPQPDIENIAERLAFKLSGEYCIDFCEETTNCIETSESVQNALNNFNGVKGLNFYPENNEKINESILSDSGCNPDVIYGQVTGVWNVINRTTIDFLEILSAAGNIAEAQGKVISAIPVIGQLPADEIIDFVGKFSEWTLDAYEAFLTTSLENEIKCDLFCIALDNEDCLLTTGQLIDYFSGRVGAISNIKVQTLEDFINFMIALPENTAIAFVCGMALAQLYIVSILENFLGFSTINAYVSFAQLGDPSDDWIGLCEDCPVFWNWTSDFPSDENIWIPRNSTGDNEAVWVSGQGFNQVQFFNNPDYWRIDAIEASFTATTIAEIDMVYSLTKGTYAAGTYATVGIFCYSGGSSGTLVASNSLIYSAATNGSDLDMHLDVNDEIDYIFVFVRSSFNQAGTYNGLAKVSELTILGEGGNPFD